MIPSRSRRCLRGNCASGGAWPRSLAFRMATAATATSSRPQNSLDWRFSTRRAWWLSFAIASLICSAARPSDTSRSRREAPERALREAQDDACLRRNELEEPKVRGDLQDDPRRRTRGLGLVQHRCRGAGLSQVGREKDSWLGSTTPARSLHIGPRRICIVCDRCDQTLNVGGRISWPSIEEAVAAALTAGWVGNATWTFCHECRPKVSEG